MNTFSLELNRRHPLTRWALASLVLVLVAAVSAGYAPDGWFQSLRKPSWQPPNWLFAPVWSLIYLCLAAALAQLLLARAGLQRRQALLLFGLQLLFNAMWTPLFFGLHSPLLAFVDICLLWTFALASTLTSLKLDNLAAWLQVPHLLWVSFALILNGVILALNW